MFGGGRTRSVGVANHSVEETQKVASRFLVYHRVFVYMTEEGMMKELCLLTRTMGACLVKDAKSLGY